MANTAGNIVSFRVNRDSDRARASRNERQRRYRRKLRERVQADPEFRAELAARKRAMAFMPPGRLESAIDALMGFRLRRGDDDHPDPDAFIGPSAARAVGERLNADVCNAIRYLPAARVATACAGMKALRDAVAANAAADAAEKAGDERAADAARVATDEAFKRYAAIRGGALVVDAPDGAWPDDLFNPRLVAAKKADESGAGSKPAD